MWFHDFLSDELFGEETIEAVKVSLDGPAKPAVSRKPAATAEAVEEVKTGKRKADAGQERPDSSLNAKRKVDAGGSGAFDGIDEFDVPLLAEFGSTTAEPLLFDMFAACTNGANQPPADHPDCTKERAAVFDFDDDGDIDADDFDTLAHCYHGPDEPIACEDQATTEAILSLAPSEEKSAPLPLTPSEAVAPLEAGTSAMTLSASNPLQLYHYRARAMDPVLGRFVQRDPLERV